MYIPEPDTAHIQQSFVFNEFLKSYYTSLTENNKATFQEKFTFFIFALN